MVRLVKHMRGRPLLELTGWLVFTVSACGFLVSSLLAADFFAICGSVLFLLGCLLFLAPLLAARKSDAGVGHGPLPRHDACKACKKPHEETRKRGA